MLNSQIVLDHGRMDSNSRMEQVANIPTLSEIIKEPVSSRKRHRSLTGPGSKLSSRQSLNFDSDSNNNDEEEHQTSQMLTILRDVKRKSIIAPSPLSPSLSSSTYKSPSRPRTPGPASRTMHKKASYGDVLSSSTYNKKPLGVSKSGRRLTVGGISTEKMSRSQGRTVSCYHNDNDLIPNIQELDTDLVGTARSSRSEPKKKAAKVVVTTGVIVKEEKPDDGYEPMAPSYDAINDVEIIASIHTCPTCNKEFDSRGKMKAHVSKAHPDKHPVKHYNCPHCAWTSIYPGSLRAHMVQSHKNKVGHSVCSFCTKKFTSSATWEKHISVCVKRTENKKDVQLNRQVPRKTFKSSPSTHTCLDCFKSFSSRQHLLKHKIGCKSNGPSGPPFICKHCNAILTKKKGWAQHVRYNCSVLKEKARKSLMKDSENDNNLAQGKPKEGGDNDDTNNVTDHGDLEDNRDEHVSCKECRGKLFTPKDFERHHQQTGHTGDIIKLPPNLSI